MLLFIIKMHRVHCEVGTETINKTEIIFMLQCIKGRVRRKANHEFKMFIENAASDNDREINGRWEDSREIFAVFEERVISSSSSSSSCS